jgi:hypothetical protein
VVKHGIVVCIDRWSLASPKAAAIARLGKMFTSGRIDPMDVSSNFGATTTFDLYTTPNPVA